MDASSNSSGEARPLQAPGAWVPAGAEALGAKWLALHDAAAVAAGIAGVEAPALSERLTLFPVRAHKAGGWRGRLIEQGIDDLSAVMEPGLAALLAAHSRGGQPQAAALSLWREFVRARDAVVALLPDLEPADPSA